MMKNYQQELLKRQAADQQKQFMSEDRGRSRDENLYRERTKLSPPTTEKPGPDGITSKML